MTKNKEFIEPPVLTESLAIEKARINKLLREELEKPDDGSDFFFDDFIKQHVSKEYWDYHVEELRVYHENKRKGFIID